MMVLPSMVSTVRSWPTPAPVSRICAINGCHMAPNGPISAQTLSAGALSTIDSATVCNSAFGGAR